MRRAARRLLADRVPWLALRLFEPDARELGLAGESLAAAALRRAGWRLAGRRVRTPPAEVDLVVTAGDLLVCVEVKTRRPHERARWRPGDRLDARTLARQRAAARWLAGRRGARRARVDLVEVEVGRGPLVVRLRHTPDLDRPVG